MNTADLPASEIARCLLASRAVALLSSPCETLCTLLLFAPPPHFCSRTAGEWIATEKIHGSNFSFVTDGTSVAVAKRTGLLQPVDKFFNWPYIYGKVQLEVGTRGGGVAEAQ